MAKENDKKLSPDSKLAMELALLDAELLSKGAHCVLQSIESNGCDCGEMIAVAIVILEAISES